MGFAGLIQRWRERCDPSGRVLVWFLWLLIVGFCLYLGFGENPWDRGAWEKLENGEKLTIRDSIVVGLWVGTSLNVVLTFGLILTSWWWAAPLHSRSLVPRDPPVETMRGFWILLMAAMLFGGLLRAPRLDHSFWNDEEQAFRKFTWGAYVEKEGGGFERRDTGWDRALYYTMSGNNHIAHTVGARFWDGVWRRLSGAPDERFREAVVRLAPFIDGVLTIGMLGVLLQLVGWPRAGATAAWLLALSPWHVRYAVEARGYSSLLLYLLLALFFLILALRSGRWRWWVAYGLCQCVYLLCFAGAIYFAAALNGLLLVGLMFVRRDGPMIGRWFFANALGAILFLQVSMPVLLRIFFWMTYPRDPAIPIDGAWLGDLWCHLVAGIPWAGGDLTRHFGIGVADMSAWARVWLLVLAPVALVIGGLLALGRCRELRVVLLAFPLSILLACLHNQFSEMALFGWYLFYLSLAFCIAIGFVPSLFEEPSGHSSVAARGRLAVTTPSLAMLVLLIGYGVLTAPAWNRLRQHDRHPMRQAVEVVRGEAPALGAEGDRLMTLAVGSGSGQFLTYDPRAVAVKSAKAFRDLEAEALAEGMALGVYVVSPERVARDHPGIWSHLLDSGTYELGPYLRGMEEFWSIQTFLRRPEGSVPAPRREVAN